MAKKNIDNTEKVFQKIIGTAEKSIEEKTKEIPIKETENVFNDLIKVKAKRSKRVNYAITEETDKLLKEKSIKLGVSVNEIVNQLLDKFVADMAE